MSRFNFKSWILIPVMLLIGTVVGLSIPFSQIRNLVAQIFELQDAKPDDEPEDDEVHVEVTETAHKSLGLRISRAKLGEYTPTYDIPATIKELPGAQSIKLSSRFNGLVTKVLVSEGQSVRPGDPVFELELTGEQVSKTQAELLLAIRKTEIMQDELDRLEPLVKQGGLANKRFLELTYEQKQLFAEINTRQQELLLHGLSETQVSAITQSRQLVKSIVIHVPGNLLTPQLNLPHNQLDTANRTFVVESVNAQSGAVIKPGDDLCHLAFHELLVVEGHAFERDLPQVKELMEKQTDVTVSVGTFSDIQKIPQCKVAYLSIHANAESNTYPFVVYLTNERIAELSREEPFFQAWKWKPGQLAHIELPRKKYEQMIILPREAVAEDGVSRIVFEWKGQVAHDHEHGPDDNHEHADEYVPIEVDVVYMDEKVAVVNPAGNLKVGTRIAFNNANHLLFAMQSGSGGHGHSHPH